MKRLLKKDTRKITISDRLNAQSIFSNIKHLKQITFEVTEKCNLACAYCAYGKYYDFASGRTLNDIPFVYIENILKGSSINYFLTINKITN